MSELSNFGLLIAAVFGGVCAAVIVAVGVSARRAERRRWDAEIAALRRRQERGRDE